ncbi:MAG: hypothetical protein D6731_26095 [Planctomycetota bacterium]|nr:MAG: hypothetical protein D6731_26095 [Planctomycetota bacterium]
MRVLFVHGLMSSPQGVKARYLAERFEALTPAMDTGDFLGCLAVQREAIASFRPEVVVGSSFGGAVLLALMHAGDWRGPALFLAQAAVALDPDARLPRGAAALLVHGLHDEVIPVEHSRRLAATGEPARTRLVEVDDGHRLLGLVERDELADRVRDAAALG